MNVSVAVVPNSILDNHVGIANDTHKSSDWLDCESLSLNSVSDCGAEFTSPNMLAFDLTVNVIWTRTLPAFAIELDTIESTV